ncbi:MAG TPA: succinate dehydrogenase assembly factor 2 family protein [Gammaproteobacteria bacterium]|nr:succinate dehydrogenase assembly factor 2 family protein [Gammaproteobacteria bacterium]
MFSKAEKGRLRWRSRRGMLELDLLLVPFFDERFEGLTIEQQQNFVTLLEQDDPDLIEWFARRERAQDESLQALVEMILDHA